jgi:hypothetical protein
MMRRAAGLICASLLLFLLLPPAGLGLQWRESTDRIEDAAFWRMFSEFSEPGGFFQSDNFVSNERTFPTILADIASLRSANGGYVGVGPEQNFSYVAALRPRIAFIVDIRRQNAILHLLYKALFELAPNRADFLSRLFSRPRPRGLGSASSVGDLFAAFAAAPPSPRRFEANLKEIQSRLVEKHRFALNDEDLGALKYVYSAFFEAGPALQYSHGSSRRGRPFPTFAELMTAMDDQGVARSFLAREESYETLREMQRRNLIIPVVGDFAGNRALKSVAAYLGGRALTATVFYASNVESYLFRNDDWRIFYGNLAALPVDRRSVLVRSVFGGFGGFGGAGADYPGTGRPGSLQLDPLEDLAAAFRRGEVSSYGDLLARSK